MRLVAEDDLFGLLKTNGHGEVTRYLPWATWQGMADAQAWRPRMAALQATGTAHQFAVVRKDSQDVIGSSLLFRFNAGSALAELGCVLGRAHWC
jgi:[ribosomal protein S5]-alanine N-acetyltransferase